MPRNRRKSERERIDKRLSVITPLLPYAGKEDMESKRTFWMLRREAAKKYGLTTKTIDRYLKAYNKEGSFFDLASKYPTTKKSKLSDEIIDRAVELKKEQPLRSIEFIIDLLVQEGLAKKGEVKRTTLQDALAKRGCSSSELRVLSKNIHPSSRYEASARNELWLADIKYGPKIMYNGELKQLYLSVVLDDHSRHIVSAKFYTSQGAAVVLESLKQAVTDYGVPIEVYFDNGKMYTSKLVGRFCRILGIHRQLAPPYRAQAKGKIERFFLDMDAFLAENALNPATTLSQLNERLAAWIERYHEHRINRDTHQEPEERYMMSHAKQNFVSKELIEYASRHEIQRKVDKCGDISFHKRDFHVGLSYARQTVTLIYDYSDLTVLYMHNTDGNIVEVRARKTGRYVNKPKMPEAEKPSKPSNYFDNLNAEAASETSEKAPETLFDYADSTPEEITQTIRYDDNDEEDW